MKKQLLVLALGVAICPFYAKAQYNNGQYSNGQYGVNPQAGDVNITSGPNVSNVSGNTATLSWTTDKTAANRVEYRADGENSWHSAYEPGGSTNHTVTLSNLIPGRNYQFRIMTRDNQVRTAGNFSTAGNGGYNNGGYSTGANSGTYNNGAVGSRGDRDRDNDANRGDRDRDNGSGYRTDRDNDANRGDRDRDNGSGYRTDNDANRGDHDRDNNAVRTDRDNDANHMDRDHDQNRANADNDRDHDKNKNHKDKDKNKNKSKDKDDNQDKDHDKDSSNPR